MVPKKSPLERELEMIGESMERQIEAVAKREFEAVIKPWLIEKQYSMLVGNGTNYIFDPFETAEVEATGRHYHGGVDLDSLPAHIQNVMKAPIPHRGNSDLGDWMPNFDYIAYQSNEEGKSPMPGGVALTDTVNIIDRYEHGSGGVARSSILATLSLEEALEKTPYDYDVTEKLFGFWPVITAMLDLHDHLYYWDDDEQKWLPKGK